MDQNQLHAFQAMMIFMPFFILGFVVLMIIPYWMIWKKAGFSPWFSLLMFVPLVNFIMLYVLAFSEWKVVPITQAPPVYSYPPSSLPPQQL
jgi:predicted neutral ceramidase superfamily lipid hydrolase